MTKYQREWTQWEIARLLLWMKVYQVWRIAKIGRSKSRMSLAKYQMHQHNRQCMEIKPESWRSCPNFKRIKCINTSCIFWRTSPESWRSGPEAESNRIIKSIISSCNERISSPEVERNITTRKREGKNELNSKLNAANAQYELNCCLMHQHHPRSSYIWLSVQVRAQFNYILDCFSYRNCHGWPFRIRLSN